MKKKIKNKIVIPTRNEEESYTTGIINRQSVKDPSLSLGMTKKKTKKKIVIPTRNEEESYTTGITDRQSVKDPSLSLPMTDL